MGSRNSGVKKIWLSEIGITITKTEKNSKNEVRNKWEVRSRK